MGSGFGLLLDDCSVDSSAVFCSHVIYTVHDTWHADSAHRSQLCWLQILSWLCKQFCACIVSMTSNAVVQFTGIRSAQGSLSMQYFHTAIDS